MPAIDSIAVAAMAMPYRPASACAPQIAMHTAITGIAVDFIEMPRPAMMLVPWPVVDAAAMCCTGLYWVPRSEEHTSELQSLMRISYAVFCLKKKKMLYIVHR